MKMDYIVLNWINNEMRIRTLKPLELNYNDAMDLGYNVGVQVKRKLADLGLEYLWMKL